MTSQEMSTAAVSRANLKSAIARIAAALEATAEAGVSLDLASAPITCREPGADLGLDVASSRLIAARHALHQALRHVYQHDPTLDSKEV